MSNKSTVRFFVVLLFAVFSSAALVLADAGALGQNANSSTTEESVQNDNANANMSAPRRGRRGRRRPPAEVVNEIAVIAPVAQDDDSRGDLSGERVDLSGTYTGNLTTAGGGGEVGNGKATLTINGNQFTLESGGATHNGRVYAVLTRGETSAAFYFPDISVGTPPTPLVYNVRARKRGDRLTLTPAPRTALRLTFR